MSVRRVPAATSPEACPSAHRWLPAGPGAWVPGRRPVIPAAPQPRPVPPAIALLFMTAMSWSCVPAECQGASSGLPAIWTARTRVSASKGAAVNIFDVRIYTIRRRRDRRRPFEVRWRAAGRTRSRSFTTRGLADSYRAELIRAARHGLEFSPGTGEPARWAGRNLAAVSWQEHAAAYAAMKWPHAAAHTRAGIADALATITPALTKPATRKPAPAVLRTALYQHAFSPAQPGTGPAAAAAPDWAQRHSLPLQELDDPKVIRLALEALTLRLDGARAAATTITRKRAVFYNALGYAAELGLLASNPLDRIPWKRPRASGAVDPRLAASPAQVLAILTEVTRIRPELTAFFGCLYYAALRPAEAVALRRDDCELPERGWGRLTLSASSPRSAHAWTGNGTPHEQRGLKLRPEGTIRAVPIPRSSPGSSARTSTLTALARTGGCSAPPAAGSCTKAATAAPGTPPAPPSSARN